MCGRMAPTRKVSAPWREVTFGLPGSRPSMGRCRAARAGRNEVEAGERATC